MSSEREMKLLKGLLEELKNEKEGQQLSILDRDYAKETKGFQSLVTEEEYEALTHLAHAFDYYVGVHNKCSLNHLNKVQSSYQRLQYAMFSDLGKDLARSLVSMLGIHTFDKEHIDDWASEENLSVEELTRKVLYTLILRD